MFGSAMSYCSIVVTMNIMEVIINNATERQIIKSALEFVTKKKTQSIHAMVRGNTGRLTDVWFLLVL